MDTEFGKTDPDGAIDTYFDNRAIFDEYRNRFWVGALAYNSRGYPKEVIESDGKIRIQDGKKLRSKFVVAVSKTENPLEGWYMYWWDAAAGDGQPGVNGFQPGDNGDYPTFGIDKLGVYQTNIVKNVLLCFDSQGKVCREEDGSYKLNVLDRYHMVNIFPADALANGTATTGWFYNDLKNPDGSLPLIQPVVQHGINALGPVGYLVSRYGANKILIWRLTNPTSANRQLELAQATVAPFDYPLDAPQKGSTQKIKFTNLGTDILNAVFRSSQLYLTMNDAATFGGTKLTACRLVRLYLGYYPNIDGYIKVDRAFGGAAVDDPPNSQAYYGWPAVEVNRRLDMVVAYGRSGTQLYPEVRYSVHYDVEQDIRPSRLLKAGQDPIKYGADPAPGKETLIQLHDLNSAAVDPYDDEAVWMAAPYATALNNPPAPNTDRTNYAVWVGKVFGVKHPDLIVNGPVNLTAGPHKPGDQIGISAQIRNQGDGGSQPAKYSVYLSSNAQITASDRKIGEGDINALNSGGLHVAIASVKLPNDLALGHYYVGLLIDSGNQSNPQFQEYSVANNSGHSARRLIVRNVEANTFLPSPGAKWHEAFGFGDEIPRVGDFNGDGRDDIVAFNRSSGDVFVALSDGAKFAGTPQAWHTDFSFGNERPVVGDFNGDGRDDIANFIQDTKFGTASAEVYVALSTGSGFGPRVKWHDAFSGKASDRVAAGDFDGDGRDDLVAFATSDGGVYIVLSDGVRFSPTQLWRSSFAFLLERQAVGDFNRDGKADIVALDPNTRDARVAISNGTAFGAPVKWHDDLLGVNETPAAGDFNGDGRDDVAVFTRGTSADVFVATSNSASFKAPREKWHDVFAFNQETPLVGDFNGDGADDIVTFLGGSSGDVYVALARRLLPVTTVAASSYSGSSLAKESIVAAFGSDLAPATQVATSVPLPTTLIGTTVEVTDSAGASRLSPLFFVAPAQINYQIPPGTAVGEAAVLVSNRSGPVGQGKAQIVSVAPGLFTANANGRGPASAVVLRVRANGAQQFEQVVSYDDRLQQFVPIPIDFGPSGDQLFLILFGSGFRFNSSLSAVSVQIGGVSAQSLFAGPQGGFVGLDQLNVALPRSLAGRGAVDIALTVDRQAANIAQISFK